ncbi:ABC transporter substrate-binding protein [Blastococcus litoris]|uniref:ABC transporter substrate-binding protein n=1 Tax=Blastococcus litoris TaxID=2171622 RepID=UPI0019D0A3A2|nr:ABC transporter substrate-binding protein [Blastococcus litoris]
MLTPNRLLKPAAALGLAVVLAACGGTAANTGGGGGDPASGGDSDAVEGAVNIGAVLPLTGSSASIGEDQRRGIELAVAKINEDGGVMGKDLNVIVEDSAGAANAAIDAAKKLVSVDDVAAVMGEYSSGVTVPLGQYLQQEGVIHMNVGSSSPEIAGIGDKSFSVIGLDTIASKFASEQLAERGLMKAAIMVPNNSYGEGIVDPFTEAYEAAGGSVTETILYTEGQTSYRAELERIAASQPDVVLYSAYGQDSSVINQQAFEGGMQETPWFGIYLTMCTSDSAPETVQDQIGMDVNYVGPEGQDYQDAYQEEYGEDFASTFSGYTYDATMMLAEAIEKAGSTDADAIAEALGTIGQGYAGVTGDITFDDQNQRSDQPYLVLKYTDGKVVEES